MGRAVEGGDGKEDQGCPAETMEEGKIDGHSETPIEWLAEVRRSPEGDPGTAAASFSLDVTRIWQQLECHHAC
jgi:hypothetical protein